MKKTEIYTLLRKRYKESEYALMEEVSDAAGFNRSRSADYVVMSLWPSRGLALSGIELKSFRGDWLGELKNPKKAENIFKYCDYFWLLITDENIAKLEEIPDTWGWMVIKGSRIIVKKEAPKQQPVELSRNFLAAMLKRAQDKTNFVHVDSIEDKILQEREYQKTQCERSTKILSDNLTELKSAVDEFEKASGVQIRSYERWGFDPTKMGEALKFIRNGGPEKITEDLKKLEYTAENIKNSITHGLQTFNQLKS